jgi:FlaA1/EpsC-like NDP-sugar epimerase/lipopolysaccharide/colanic/teichoic acid biosynthesis glycosyltransferase
LSDFSEAWLRRLPVATPLHAMSRMSSMLCLRLARHGVEMNCKRSLDICGAAFGLLASLPLLVVVAIAVKLDSSGPVFLTSPRVGRRGRLFRLYKFRSLSEHSDAGPPVTGGTNSRVTRVGRIIRLLRIDELPQLMNVLKGDMSLVGPGAETPSIVERYTPEQREVLEVRPGITGPTQLALLKECAEVPAGVESTDDYVSYLVPRNLERELHYVRTRTFAVDVRLLLRTPLHLAHSVFGQRHLRPLLKISRLLTDFAAVGIATYFAFYARFDGEIPQPYLWILMWGLPFELAMYAIAFLYLRTYRSIWRYAGVEDCWQLAKAVVIGGSLNSTFMHLSRWPYPRSVVLLTPAFVLLLLAGIRLTWRTLATRLGGDEPTAERCRVVIVGAGRTGAAVAREILSTPRLAYDVVGFVDDNRHLQHARLHNLPVLGTSNDLQDLARKHRLREAIIAIPRPKLSELRRIREACTRAGLVFKTLPSLGQLVSGDGEVRYLRKVDVGELLQRGSVPLQMEEIAGFLKGKRVMVTGAGGSIGSELCRQIVRVGADSLLMVERAENPLFAMCGELQTAGSRTKLTAALADIKHILRMSELFSHFRPQVVFHTAAYKHVPMLESHPTEAVLNNVIGTTRLANLANAHSVEAFIFISTDKAVRPNNLMGATKRICELYLMALCGELATKGQPGATSKFRIVRFGNVLGSDGSALPLFQRQIEKGGPITITDPEVSRFFMTIEEAVGLVLQSATLDLQGGIAVLDMGQPIKITNLADDFVTALGLPPSLVPRQVIGLRPGEKLHEVLWDDVDEVLPSPHSGIVVVRPRGRALNEMEAFVRQLEQLAVDGNVGPLLAKVQEIVPSYTGNVDNGQPWVLHLDPEPRKPLAPVNGTTTKSSGAKPIERRA